MQPKKHAAIIKAWADGATIERYSIEQKTWVDEPWPMFMDDLQYRIKEENVIRRQIYMDTLGNVICVPCVNPHNCNIEFVFSSSGLLEGVKRI
jgi:hypothetical protein